MTCNGTAATPDLSKLTDLQCSVWLKDQDGLRPIEIGEQLGLTPRRVCNIKARLRELGLPVNQLWTVKQLAGHQNGAAFEPGDDESPDLDEPVQRGPIQRCACGLAMPCHDCVSLEHTALSRPDLGAYPDGGEDDSW